MATLLPIKDYSSRMPFITLKVIKKAPPGRGAGVTKIKKIFHLLFCLLFVGQGCQIQADATID